MEDYKEKQFKDMRYKSKRDISVLYEENIDGYLILIVSLGTHPCAYIGLPKKHILESVDYSTLSESDIYGSCHGGFTYSDYGVVGFYESTWFLGWDYAHGGDYSGYDIQYDEMSRDNKKWTTKEIYEDALNQLEELKKVKKDKKEVEVFKIENGD